MKRAAFICLIAFTFFSCQKDVSFEGSLNHQPQLVIEGILHPDETPKIYVSSSVSFFNEKVLPQEVFARKAVVLVSTDDWTEQLQPDSTFEKFRCRWLPFFGGTHTIAHGKTYHLTVSYEGNNYTASTTIDQPKVNLTDVEYTPEFFDVYGGHDGVIIRFKDAAGTGNFYRFQMDRWMDNTRLHAHALDGIVSSCTGAGELFLTTDLGRTIFSDQAVDGEDMEFNVEVSYEYLKGDTATIYLQSLDKKSAAFFKDLDDQLQSILNPFVEPTFIHSTIEGTLGVFGSAVRSDPVLFIYPQDNP